MKCLEAKYKWIFICIVSLCIGCTAGYAGTTAGAADRLNKGVYSLVQGKWYTENTSAGYDVRFTRSEARYYDRKTGKLSYTVEIAGSQNIKKGYYQKGYLIKLKRRYKRKTYKYSYYIRKKRPNIMWFYSGWKADGNRYSGSASLTVGKWR